MVKSRRIQRRLFDILQTCKQHGGSITPQYIELLNTLNEEDIIKEVKYQKVTIAKDIRMKRRLTHPIIKKYTCEKMWKC